jgi:hypothetical protein
MEAFFSTREEFVGVRLMTDVPHDSVTGHIENIVEGNRQLNDPKARSQVAARLGNGLDNHITNLLGQFRQVRALQPFEILW